MFLRLFQYIFGNKPLNPVGEFDGTLATGKVGNKYIVTTMCEVHELMERGVVPGQILEIKHINRDLISFSIDGSQFATRTEIARCIKVNEIWDSH